MNTDNNFAQGSFEQNSNNLEFVQFPQVAKTWSHRESVDWLKNEVKQGRLPESYKRELKIAESSNEAELSIEADLKSYCNRLITNLISTNWAKENLIKENHIPEFEVKVVDEDNPNSSIIPTFTPPVLLVTKGLLRLVAAKGESVLAGVLAHEFWHYYSRGYIKSEKNSKLEEGIGYFLPPLMLFYAGYDYRALDNILNRRDVDVLSRIIHMTDIHPSPSLTNRILEDSYVVINQTIKRTGISNNGSVAAFKDSNDLAVVTNAQSLNVEDPIGQQIDDYEDRYYHDHSDLTKSKEIAESFIRWVMEQIPLWLEQQLDPYELIRRSELISKFFESIFNGVTGRTPDIDVDILEEYIDFSLSTPFNTPTITVIKFLSAYIYGRKDNHHSKYFNSDKDKTPCSPLLRELEFNVAQLLNVAPGSSVEQTIDAAKGFWKTVLKIHPSKYYLLEGIFFGTFPDMSTEKDSFDLYMRGELHENAVNVYELFKEGSSIQKLAPIDKNYQVLVTMAQVEQAQYGSMYLLQTLEALGIFQPTYFQHRQETVEALKEEIKYFNITPGTFFMDGAGNILTESKSVADFWQSFRGLNVGRSLQCYIEKDLESLERWGNKGILDERLAALSENELFSQVHDEILRQRQSMADYDRITDFLLEVSLSAVESSIRGIRQPSDLYYLFETYPYFFALRPRLLGGSLSDLNNLASIKACELLVERLSQLVAEDPQIWRDVVLNELFSKNEQSQSSVYYPTQQLKDSYNLYLLQGKHQYLNYDISDLRTESGGRKEYTIDLVSKLEIGLPLDHPYVRFLFENFEQFPIEQVVGILDKTFFVQERLIDGEWLLDPQVSISARDFYHKITGQNDWSTTEEELRRRIILAKTFDNLDDESSFMARKEFKSNFLTIMAREDILNYIKNLGESDFVSAETLELLIQIAKVVTEKTNENIYEGYESQWHRESEDYGPFGEEILEEIDDILEKTFLNLDTIATNDPQELANLYVLMETNGYFRKYPKYRYGENGNVGIDDALVKTVSSMEDPNISRRICEIIIFNTGVESVAVRNKLIEVWVETVYEEFGEDPMEAFEEPDDTTDNSKKVFLDHLSQLVEILKTNIGDKPEIVNTMSEMISNKLKLQYYSVKFLNDSLEPLRNKSSLEYAIGKGFFLEGGHEFITSEEDTRLLTIGLLTEPLTDVAIQGYIDHLEFRRDKTLTSRNYHDTSIDKFLLSLTGDPVNTIYARATRDINFKSKITRDQIEGQIRLVYENFWTRNFEERTYLLSTLVFPHNRKIEDAQDIEPLVNYVLDKVLPYDQTKALDEGNNLEVDLARDFILAYAKVTPINEQRILFSALMASAHSFSIEEHNSSEYIGKALATILANLGPAGVKLAQAIHSYPETPESIRNGMANVKGNINLPERFDVFARLIKILGYQEAQEKFKWIGGFLGAGSYQYTLQAVLGDESPNLSALTILRSHANAYAKNEFEHIKRAMISFINIRNSKGKSIDNSVIQSVEKLIEAASNNIDIETNYETNVQQLELMREIYEGNTITVNGTPMYTRVVNSKGFYQRATDDEDGKDNFAYKVETIAPGVSLNSNNFRQLPEALREKVAIAMELVEYMIIFSGSKFEHDRQGENMNIQYLAEDTNLDGVFYPAGSIIITHYDPGAMYIREIAETDIEILGDVLVSLFQAYITNQDVNFSEIFLNVVKDKTADSKSDYLSSLFRAFLARGDIRRHINSQEYILSIIKVILESGVISPQLISYLLTKVGNNPLLMQLFLNQQQLLGAVIGVEVTLNDLSRGLQEQKS